MGTVLFRFQLGFKKGSRVCGVKATCGSGVGIVGQGGNFIFK